MVVNNPNNWHWVDKNCIGWAREYFTEKLVGVAASSASQSVKIASLKSLEGDVVVSQRKGKIISLFDLKLVVGFEGKVEDTTVSGTLTVPEVAYDTEKDEYQFDIAVFSETGETTKIREVLRSKLIPQLRDILAQFGKDLLAANGSDIQLPPDEVKSNFTKANQVQSSQSTALKTTAVNTSVKPASVSTEPSTSSTASSANVPKYNTSTLHLSPVFNTTAEQLYITFLDKQRIVAWTRSRPDFDGDALKEGSSFSLFGGNVSGKVLKLVPNEKIEQSWRLNDWKQGHYANLSISMYQGDGETKLDVLFKGIPIGEEDQVQSNFEDYYIRSIKLTFGFGAIL